MSDLVRVSMSLEKSLYERLEALQHSRGYANRSEFFRDLFREALVDDAWRRGGEALATLTVLYDHHAHGLTAKLISLQHEHGDAVLANLHLHVSRDHCAEVIVLRGPAERLREIADAVRRTRGVLHAALAATAPGEALA